MKKTMTMLLSATLVLAMVGCGNNTPSEEDVRAAIDEGTLTIEDAFEKGYVDEAFVAQWEADIEANSVEAMDKTQANILGAFETTTLSGDAFTNEDLAPVTFIAFLNASSTEGITQYEILNDCYADVQAAGAEILVMSIGDTDKTLFEDAEMNVVHYNDSVTTALGSLYEMVNADGFVGSWNANDAFMSAWYMSIDADGFAETGLSMVESYGTPTTEDESATTMVPMG